jgi:excisionase family DNA binding protein
MSTSTTTPAMLLTPRQAAHELQISERKLWSLTNDGQIKAVRFGRAVRYDRSDLEAAIRAAKS